MESGNQNHYTQGIRKHNWNWNSKFVGEHISKMEISKTEKNTLF